MKNLHFIILAALVGLFLLATSLFKVEQYQYAVIFQFGEAVRVISQPGLNIKIPLIQNVVYFDKRLSTVEVAAKELTASDGKRFIVNAFAKFKINDPVTFFKTVNNYQGARVRLSRILESSMRKVIGRITLTTLLSKDRSQVMEDISSMVNDASKWFGIDIVDVRILRTDLPKENSAAIYQRMQTERYKEASQIIAEGNEMAAKIRSKADKERSIILAEADMQAQILKGEGDAEAARIYNEVYSKDPEFYRFYQSLNTCSNVLKEDTNFILSPNSGLLKVLNLGQ